MIEACAISCYRQETGISIVKILVCDDAAQFKLLTDLLALCWVHNGRHYKRLNPLVPLHQEKLAEFRHPSYSAKSSGQLLSVEKLNYNLT